MNDMIKLVDSEFSLVPAGLQVLTIDSAKAMPKAKPTKIEVVFKHANGGQIKNTYDLKKKIKATDKNPIGLVLFSILARIALSDSTLEDFSLSEDLPRLVGKKIECKVKHTEPNENGNIFANIERIIKLAYQDDEDDLDEEVEADEDDEEDDL